MKQVDLFDSEQETQKEAERKDAYEKWKGLNKRSIVFEKTPERKMVWQNLRRWIGLVYKGALHECPELPADKYIWLNEVEAPEYWVLNDRSSPVGESIEVCPYCGADLKNGEGKVVLLKADAFGWKLNGMLRRVT